jgi:hypothetical protein
LNLATARACCWRIRTAFFHARFIFIFNFRSARSVIVHLPSMKVDGRVPTRHDDSVADEFPAAALPGGVVVRHTRDDAIEIGAAPPLTSAPRPA